MLSVEHIFHGEVVSYPPFLTAGLSEVFQEMMSVGIPMTLIIFMLWGTMVVVSAMAKNRLKYVQT
jgi:hypothetical protein